MGNLSVRFDEGLMGNAISLLYQIPGANILAPRLYPALILYPEDGLNVPSELVFRNDMIQINVRCV